MCLRSCHAPLASKRRGQLHTPSAPRLFPQAQTIEELRARAKHCKACNLWRNATQTVFGEGVEHPKILFIGEQPGDQEDLQVRAPFDAKGLISRVDKTLCRKSGKRS